MKKKELVLKEINSLISKDKSEKDISVKLLINLPELSNISASTIRNTHREFFKAFKKTKISLREAVFDFLEENQGSTLDKTVEVFVDCNRNSVKKYYYVWLKESQNKKGSSNNEFIEAPKTKADDILLRNKIFSYLEINPKANLIDLKLVFPEGKQKLITYFRDWKLDNKVSEQSKPAIIQKEKSDRQLLLRSDNEINQKKDKMLNLNAVKKNIVGILKFLIKKIDR